MITMNSVVAALIELDIVVEAGDTCPHQYIEIKEKILGKNASKQDQLILMHAIDMACNNELIKRFGPEKSTSLCAFMRIS